MIIFEVNFLLIYKNIDEFDIVCKKKKSVLQENYDHFGWSVFFLSLVITLSLEQMDRLPWNSGHVSLRLTLVARKPE